MTLSFFFITILKFFGIKMGNSRYNDQIKSFFRSDLSWIMPSMLIFLLYGMIAQGGEFFEAYRQLVISPDGLIPAFGHPLTYNPPWLAILLAPFITMPGRSGFIFFIATTIIMFIVATKILGGKPIIMLISAQLFWILWWGQIEGLVVLGVALGWRAYQRKSWQLMTIAILLAILKPQIGLFPILLLWFWSGRDKWKSFVVVILVILVSIWIYGEWPIWFIESIYKIARGTQYLTWNSSIGLWALPLLIPAVCLKLDRYSRLLAITATILLISPYMPYYSTIILLCFNLPWWSVILALIGYFPELLGTQIAWNGIVLLPLGILIWIYFPWLKRWVISLKRLRLLL